MLLDTHDYGLIQVTGPDAGKFLQGQLTCDINAITETQGSLGAHCNPQGRIISLFYLFKQAGDFYLLLPRSMITLATNALKKYAVFFKCSLNDASNLTESLFNEKKPWQYFNILEGIPSIYPETSGVFLPHELNLHELGAISFDKGCYTGQEIIARMHYRGKLKKHMYRAQATHPSTLKPGAAIFRRGKQNSEAAGTLVDGYLDKHTQHLLILIDEADTKETDLFLDQEQLSPITILT